MEAVLRQKLEMIQRISSRECMQIGSGRCAMRACCLRRSADSINGTLKESSPSPRLCTNAGEGGLAHGWFRSTVQN